MVLQLAVLEPWLSQGLRAKGAMDRTADLDSRRCKVRGVDRHPARLHLRVLPRWLLPQQHNGPCGVFALLNLTVPARPVPGHMRLQQRQQVCVSKLQTLNPQPSTGQYQGMSSCASPALNPRPYLES